jgi:hypothetical protein
MDTTGKRTEYFFGLFMGRREIMPTGSIHALFALQGRSGGGARRGGYR